MNGILGKFTARYLQQEYINHPAQTISSSCIVVILGGGMARMDQTQQPYIISYSRLIAAFKLYQNAKQNGQPCTILASGNGNPSGISEAALYTKALMEMGIPETDIIKEEKSMNTYENARYSSIILQKLPLSKVYLVTSGFISKGQSFYLRHLEYRRYHILLILSILA
ncbi:YdcF family protein [Chryseobacterium sp. CBSDS_008]|uniref:YdcF family protein n=1 Tax=Chryseobacterium sp. CBSDS_008 TaxID=3415265 RepID=UPI003CEFEB8E